MSKLKERWGVTSNFQVVLIIIVFSLNGTFATWVAKPVTGIFGLHSNTSNPWIFWPVRILLVFLIYQFTLPVVGFFFGQYKFFSNFSKKTLSRIGFKWLFKQN
jgi:hypothetical protein